MIGNEAQLFPVVISDEHNNGFWRPLRLSLFQRLKMLGQPLILLNKQYRMVSQIGSMVSSLFYAGKLVSGPGTAIGVRPGLRQIAGYFRSVYDIDSPLMLLEVSGTVSSNASKSRSNSQNASAALNLGINMINKGKIQPQDLLIITSYRAQYRLYRQLIQSLARSNTRLMGIKVRTVDSMQGCEATFVIFDVVATENIGFLRLRNRINVACSRAIDGMVILRDVERILKEKIRRRRYLGDVFNYLKKKRWAKPAIETTPNAHVPTSFVREDGLAATANGSGGDLVPGGQPRFVVEEGVEEGEQIVHEKESTWVEDEGNDGID